MGLVKKYLTSFLWSLLLKLKNYLKLAWKVLLDKINIIKKTRKYLKLIS